MRKLKETAEIVESTIKEIRKNKPITEDSIIKICRKNQINKNHIKEVGGWNRKGALN